MRVEDYHGAIIVFPDGRKGEIIRTSFTANPEVSKPKGADFHIIVTSSVVGTIDKPIRHSFSMGSYGGEIKHAVIYGKYI